MKKSFVIILIVFFPIITSAQDFKLPDLDCEKLTAELIKTNYMQAVTYLYLKENYKTKTEKYDVLNYEYPDYSICAFKQEFEYGIIYSEEQCKEAGGYSNNLIIPKTDKKDLIKLIEAFFEISSDGFVNEWNEEKTKFEPNDKGVGCYYEIIESEKHFEIDMFCGC